MPQIKSILCPVDFSEFSVNAYEYAQSLAWHYKATLFLQHVLYSLKPLPLDNFYTDSYEKICQQLRADAEEKLQQFAERHARTEIRPQCFVQDGWGDGPDPLSSRRAGSESDRDGNSRVARN
jgi:hypothetical protein